MDNRFVIIASIDQPEMYCRVCIQEYFLLVLCWPIRSEVYCISNTSERSLCTSPYSRKRKSEESPHQSSKKHKQYEDTSISGIEQLH